MTTNEFEQLLAEQQRQYADSTAKIIAEANVQIFCETFDKINTQIAGLTSAVYTQSVSQIIPAFEGDPSKFKDWIKNIEKYSTLTRLVDRDIPRIVYQASKGPTGDFIRRYLSDKEIAGENPSWGDLKPELVSRFAEITDQHQAFAVLRKIRQKYNESVQLYAER